MYDDDMGRDPQALLRFYPFLRKGKLPRTSQINAAQYVEFFRSYRMDLQGGTDVPRPAFCDPALDVPHPCNPMEIALYYLKDFIGLKGDSR